MIENSGKGIKPWSSDSRPTASQNTLPPAFWNLGISSQSVFQHQPLLFGHLGFWGWTKATCWDPGAGLGLSLFWWGWFKGSQTDNHGFGVSYLKTHPCTMESASVIGLGPSLEVWRLGGFPFTSPRQEPLRSPNQIQTTNEGSPDGRPSNSK